MLTDPDYRPADHELLTPTRDDLVLPKVFRPTATKIASSDSHNPNHGLFRPYVWRDPSRNRF